MIRANERIGCRFGRWTVTEIVPLEKVRAKRRFVCRCDCGTVKTVFRHALEGGWSTSCGCFRTELINARNRTIAADYPKEARVWTNMKGRCRNPKDAAFKHYGGRGIVVAPEWDKFSTFLNDMGPCPPGMELDRINNDGPYCKANCRWTTRVVQMNNTRVNRLIEFNGRALTASGWSEVVNLPAHTIMDRMQSGWSAERALTEVRQKARLR